MTLSIESLSHGKPTPARSHITAVVPMDTKSKAIPVHATKAYKERRGTPPLILNSVLCGMTGQLHFPVTLPPEKNPDIQ